MFQTIDYLRIDTLNTCQHIRALNTSGALSRIRQMALHIHLPDETSRAAIFDLHGCLQTVRRAGHFRFYDVIDADNWFKRRAGLREEGTRQQRHQVFVNMRFLVPYPHMQQPMWVLEGMGREDEYVPSPMWKWKSKKTPTRAPT